METDEKKPDTPSWFSNSTTLTICLGLVSCVTGILMFLKIGMFAIKEAHEWLSVAFVLAIVFHTIRHWRVIAKYAGVKRFWAIAAAVCLTAAVFIGPGVFGGGHGPGGHMGPPGMELLNNANLAQVAELAKIPPNDLLGRLKSAGIAEASPQDTLAVLAENSGKNVHELLAMILAGRHDM